MADEPSQTILVVDDTEGTRYAVARTLSKAGYTVWEATTGVDALRRAAQGPHLILLDVNLPDLDGYEVCRRIKADPATAAIPVLHLSASFVGSENRAQGLEGGADGYLVYPIEPRELFAHIQAMLRLRRAERAARQHSERLRRVAAASLAVNAAGSLADVVRVVTAEARQIVGAHQALAIVFGEGGSDDTGAASWSDKYANEDDRECESGRVESGEWKAPSVPPLSHPHTLTPSDALPAGPVRRTEAQRPAAYLSVGSDGPSLRGLLAVPFTGRNGRNLGLIQLSDRVEGEFTEEDEAILVQLAQVASVAVENARLVAVLRETDRLKDEFLAMLAHELRNPLAPILNALQVLRMRQTDQDESRWATDVANRQVQHLTRLVEDLLDVSRINRGKINLQRTRLDLAAVVARAVETSRPVIDDRRHRFDVNLPPEPVPIEGDGVRLAQVFWNLLNNAAKYTPEGGRITLTVEKEGEQAVVRVKDTGAGIAPDMLPRVFDLFAQVERTLDRAEGGLGIGLTLVRRLTEMHGGSVAAASDGPGRGSEFVVRLPLLPATELALRTNLPAGLRPAAPASRRILVVDDNRDSSNSLALLLRLLGNEVRTAHDGAEALAAVAASPPEVVLMDIGLPGLNGYEVARKMRAQPSLSRVTLVALTGYGSAEDRQRSLEAGFAAHLVKPVDLDALQALLARAVP